MIPVASARMNVSGRCIHSKRLAKNKVTFGDYRADLDLSRAAKFKSRS